MLAEPLYPLHARYFAAGDSLRSYTPSCRYEKSKFNSKFNNNILVLNLPMNRLYPYGLTVQHSDSEKQNRKRFNTFKQRIHNGLTS